MAKHFSSEQQSYLIDHVHHFLRSLRWIKINLKIIMWWKHSLTTQQLIYHYLLFHLVLNQFFLQFLLSQVWSGMVWAATNRCWNKSIRILFWFENSFTILEWSRIHPIFLCVHSLVHTSLSVESFNIRPTMDVETWPIVNHLIWLWSRS